MTEYTRRNSILRPLTIIIAAGVLLISISISFLNSSEAFRKEGRSVEGKSKAAKTLTIFAAASTTDVMSEIADAYGKEHGMEIRCNFASSSTLAHQIDAGARADVFLSADQAWMDYLAKHNLIDVESRRDLLGNSLVLIAPVKSRLSISMSRDFDLAGAFEGRIAVADMEHVPAGIYARESLEYFGWYDAISSRIVSCENVRATLKLVELKEASLGIVYSTDAMASKKVQIIGTFPSVSHSEIRYPVALLKGMKPEAKEFFGYLFERKSVEVFKRHGFLLLGNREEGFHGTASSKP